MAKRKTREKAAEQSAAPTPDTLVEFPPPETPIPQPEIPVAELAPDQHGDAYEGPASDGGDFPAAEEKKWTSKIPDSQGAGIINLGGQRKAQLIRSNRFQQMQIVITADEGVDPRPSKEDTQFLKDNGFRWRGEDKAWSRPMLTLDDKEIVDMVRAEKGDEEARRERGKRRSAGVADAEKVFAQFANTIRIRNGLEPTSFAAAVER